MKVLVLYFYACLLGNQNEVTTTFVSKDPYSDPANDIPKFLYDNEPMEEKDPFGTQPEMLREREELKRQQEEMNKIGDKYPVFKEELDQEFRRRNRPLIDLEAIIDRNVEEQNMILPLRPPMVYPPPPKPLSPIDEKTVAGKFGEFSFDHSHLEGESTTKAPKKKNWTSCEQFRKDAPLFVPEDILGINWVPFYQYAAIDEALEQSPMTIFTRAKYSIVEHFYKKYGRTKSSYTVDWNRPAMLMKQPQHGTEMLLIQAEKNGLFYSIVKIGFPENDQHGLTESASNTAIKTMQFKIFENYLAMMYCERSMVLLMARDGFEPPSKVEKEEIGIRLKFRVVESVLGSEEYVRRKQKGRRAPQKYEATTGTH